MTRAPAELGFFEHWLSLWVLACIGAGIAIGQFLPEAAAAAAQFEIARVNLAVGVLIWIMIVPMLLKVDLRPSPVRGLAAGRTARQLHRRPHLVGCGALHHHGFVWSNLAKDEPNFTLTQIALLAVAVAIGLFGLDSGAALAIVVGVLIEVPLMLLVVRAVNASRRWYQVEIPASDAVSG